MLFAACLMPCGWFPASSASAAVAANTPDHGSPQCRDALAQMHLGSPGMRYVGCDTLPDRQGKPLQATYRVPGRYAARAERLFAKAFGMPPLRRSCCQWDGPPHGFRAADGRQCAVTMVSAPTHARSRAAWSGIPAFEIIITCYTDDV